MSILTNTQFWCWGHFVQLGCFGYKIKMSPNESSALQMFQFVFAMETFLHMQSPFICFERMGK